MSEQQIPPEKVTSQSIQIRQGRNSNGRFTKYYHPLGCVCFIADNKYDTGYYIVTGVSKNGFINTIPMKTTPTSLHQRTFDINDSKVTIHIHFKYNVKDIDNLIVNIEKGIIDDNNVHPVYHNVARNAICDLNMLKLILAENEN